MQVKHPVNAPMTRFIAIITCLVASLLLIAVGGECSEISEYEPETEVECFALSSGCPVVPALSARPDPTAITRAFVRSVPSVARVSREYGRHIPAAAPAPPVRILHCVFRE